MGGTELVDVVDESDRVVGTATRAEVRRRRLRHRAVYVFVFNSRGQLLLHRRTPDKDIYPAHWDVAAGGVVAAGEDYTEAARRELEEELGIAGAPLVERLRFAYEDASNAVCGAVFTCRWDGPIRIQPEEVQCVEWALPAEALACASERPFCPDGLEALRQFLACGAERSS